MSRHNHTWVIRYQKKHSPTHTSEEEEGFAQTAKFIACGHPLCGALSQQGLLDPITPAYNQSQPDGQLKLTVSAFNGLWISMPAVLVTVSTVTQNSLQPLSTSSIIAGHFLDFMAQGKNRGRRSDNPSGHHPSRLWCASPPSSANFHVVYPFLLQPSQFVLAWDRH